MAATEVRGASAPVTEPPASPPRPRSRRHNLDVALPLTLIGLLVFACFVLPEIVPNFPGPTGGRIRESLQGPSGAHWLGTDENGNDVLSRILHGGRSSLLIAFIVQVVGLVVGGGLGALAGRFGGIVDSIIMRTMDVFIAVPALVLAIAISQALGPGMRNTVLALVFLAIPTFARIARAETLRIRQQPFMIAADLSGTSTWRVLVRHLAPNIGPPLLSVALLGMGIIIVIEGALSFLGGGIQFPAPSWGNMIFRGSLVLSAEPMLVIWPSIALFIAVVGFNSLGEALRSRWSGGR